LFSFATGQVLFEGKMGDWKMWHKNAGRENAGKENTAQEILGWKMREKSVWKACI